MILVIGGFAAGKKQWVLDNLSYCLDDFTDNIESNCPVLQNLQDINIENVEDLRKFQVIICNEVGNGLVPIDRNARHHREKTGRLCTSLATEATTVIRVICGVGVTIKG